MIISISSTEFREREANQCCWLHEALLKQNYRCPMRFVSSQVSHWAGPERVRSPEKLHTRSTSNRVLRWATGEEVWSLHLMTLRPANRTSSFSRLSSHNPNTARRMRPWVVQVTSWSWHSPRRLWKSSPRQTTSISSTREGGKRLVMQVPPSFDRVLMGFLVNALWNPVLYVYICVCFGVN